MKRQITYDKFNAGWDTRKGKYVSDANRLLLLDNLYVTKGGAIRQRPGIVKVGDLAAGSQGFESYNGKLYTFTSNVALNHGLTDIENIDLQDENALTITELNDVTATEKGLYTTATMSNGVRINYLTDKFDSTKTWKSIHQLPAYSLDIAKGSYDDENLWLAVHSDGVFYRSHDEGDNWEKYGVVIALKSAQLFYMDSKFVLVYTDNTNLNTLFKYSEDGGVTWVDAEMTTTIIGATDPVTKVSINYSGWVHTNGYLYGYVATDSGTPAVAYRIIYTQDGINFYYTADLSGVVVGAARLVFDSDFWYVWYRDVDLKLLKISDLTATTFGSPVICGGAITNQSGIPEILGPAFVHDGVFYASSGSPISDGGFYKYRRLIKSADGITWSEIIDLTDFKVSDILRWLYDAFNNKIVVLTRETKNIYAVADESMRYIVTIDLADNSTAVYAVGSNASSGVVGSINTYTSNLDQSSLGGAINEQGLLIIGSQKVYNYSNWVAASLQQDLGKQAISLSSKVFHTSDQPKIPFSATNNPLDKSSFYDAGYLPNNSSYGESLALAEYNSLLAVFYKNNIQIWQVDPDPSLMSLIKSIENIGCQYPGSIQTLSGDKVFLSLRGFRTLTTATVTGNLMDGDVGSPIDEEIIPVLPLITSTRSAYFASLGQYWCAVMYSGQCDVFVFTYSRSDKLNAWSRYRFTGITTIDNFAEYNGDVYFRSADAVYRVDLNATDDDGVAFSFQSLSPMLDMKYPGMQKDIQGIDWVLSGNATIGLNTPKQVNADSVTVNNIGQESSSEYELMAAIQIMSTDIQINITGTSTAEPFQLDSITFYFDELGYV